MTDNRDDFDANEWGNIGPESILDPGWSRKHTQAEKDQTSLRNLEIYGKGTYTLTSPGSDLLDYYDAKNALLDPTGKAFSKIPPSVVYHYRFEHEYPAKLFNKSFNYGKWAYLRDELKDYYYTADTTYWVQVYTSRFRWLTTEKSKSYTFKLKSELDAFALEHLGAKIAHHLKTQTASNVLQKGNRVNDTVLWRGKLLAGWSLSWKED